MLRGMPEPKGLGIVDNTLWALSEHDDLHQRTRRHLTEPSVSAF